MIGVRRDNASNERSVLVMKNKDILSRGFFLNAIKYNNTFILFIVIFIVASLLYDNFFTVLNLSNVLRQASILGIISIGMTLLIVSKGIDLSVGSVLALSGILAANLSEKGIVIAILVPLIVSAIIGLINGLVVTKIGMDPFVATISTMMGIRGIAYLVSDETAVGISKDSTLFFLGKGAIFGIPVPIIIFLSLLLIFSFVIKRIPFGRHVYAVGGNEEAANMMGISVNKVKIKLYMMSSVLAGVAGIILSSRLGAGNPGIGEEYHLLVIAMVILGGTLLTGGVGKLSGTFIGVLIISFITNIFNLHGQISPWWQNVLMGLIVLLVVVGQSRFNQNSE